MTKESSSWSWELKMVRNLRWPLVSGMGPCAYYPKKTKGGKGGTVKQVTTISLEQLCCTWQSLANMRLNTWILTKKRCFSHFTSQLWDAGDELSKPIHHAIAYQAISTHQWMSVLQPVLQAELDINPNFKQALAAINPLHNLQLAGQERHQGAGTCLD